ncbi:MAG: CBS domain-containing protein [Nitrospinae bacterium]|nr:CBS domain-containing protein [Nitrospinota bacterium]
MPTLSEVMTKDLKTINHGASVQTAAEHMRNHKIDSLIVEKAGNYVGVVTEADVVSKAVAERKDPTKTKVDEIMTSPIISIDAAQPLNKAHALMALQNIRHLPVNQAGQIVGIVSARDLLLHF